MTETQNQNDVDKERLMRLAGSMPWWKPREQRTMRTKIFRSGNSLAVRIPSGTKLKAGMEMDLTIDDGEFLSLEPIGRPKRKFNIAKVAGSACSLKLIDDDARLFEDRTLDWPDQGP